jgi:hypothetical protein
VARADQRAFHLGVHKCFGPRIADKDNVCAERDAIAVTALRPKSQRLTAFVRRRPVSLSRFPAFLLHPPRKSPAIDIAEFATSSCF